MKFSYRSQLFNGFAHFYAVLHSFYFMTEMEHEKDMATQNAPRRPDMIVCVADLDWVGRWALFGLTEKQRAVLRDADEVSPQEKECEWARVLLRDIDPAEASHEYMGEDVIPVETSSRIGAARCIPTGRTRRPSTCSFSCANKLIFIIIKVFVLGWNVSLHTAGHRAHSSSGVNASRAVRAVALDEMFARVASV